jgi:HAMP domain-containing protein
MKFSFTFQTLIMAALAPVLAAVTAFWGVHVYRSVSAAILAGFDHKLLTLSAGAAAFVDGDAHALYQRRPQVVTLARQPGGGLLGVAAALDELVAPEAWPGTPRPVGRLPGETYRILAADPITHTWPAVSADRAAPVVLDARSMLLRPLTPIGAAPGGTPPAPGAAVTSVAFIDPPTPQPGQGGYTARFLDVTDSFYQRNRPAFVALQRDAGLTYLYTQVYRGEKRIFYVMDGTVSAGYSRPGTGDELPDATLEGAEWVQFLGRSWISPIQKWETWGLLKSCFTPIYDSAARVIGMSGADVNVTVIRLRTRWALFSVVFVGVVTLVVAGFISLAVTRALTQPVRQIKSSALWIAAGYYDTKVEATGTREMSRLARTLNALRAHVTGEETRAIGYGRELDSRRCAALLQGALRDRIDAAREAGAVAGTFDLSPEAGGVAAGGRAILWLRGTEVAGVEQTCLQARAACLARTLLTAPPPADPTELTATLAASLPALVACATWSPETRALQVFARVPLQVTEMGPTPRVVAIAPGRTEIPISAGGRLSWAQLPPPA